MLGGAERVMVVGWCWAVVVGWCWVVVVGWCWVVVGQCHVKLICQDKRDHIIVLT